MTDLYLASKRISGQDTDIQLQQQHQGSSGESQTLDQVGQDKFTDSKENGKQGKADGTLNFQISIENPNWEKEKEKSKQVKLMKTKQTKDKESSIGLRMTTRSSKGSSVIEYMSALVWNVRGFSKSSRRSDIRENIEKFGPSIVGLIKTNWDLGKL